MAEAILIKKMAEAILSAVVQALSERLSQFTLTYFSIDLKEEVESLQRTLHTVIYVAENAEKQQTNEGLKKWLSGVQNQVFLANDLLDEVLYEDLRRGHVHHLEEVRSSSLNVTRKICDKKNFDRIIKIRRSLQESCEQSSVMNLLPGGRELNASLTSETSSFGDTSIVIGRKPDSEIILKFLLPNEFCVDNVVFIDIWGNPGVGKTTLAQVVFNEERVAHHFDVKVWVHASFQGDDDAANLKALIKATIESITGKSSSDLPNSLDTMQQRLRKHLEQKNFLLVLDGMLNDRVSFLYKLKNMLMSVGANGSKVLITTQTRNIHKHLDTIYSHYLETLTKDDCKEVIKKYAFRNRNPHVYQDLEEIVDKIAVKCSGLPLAATRFGMLLMAAEFRRDKWELISRREVGDVLRENYDLAQTLPSSVKRCFAYTSIFPPKFEFLKEQLVQQWLALDFISTEERGREYFDLMFSRSFFQYFQFNHTEEQQTYVMDDDIRNIAISVAGEECFMMNQHSINSISELARHASLSPIESPESSITVPLEFPPQSKGLFSLILFAQMQIRDNIATLRGLRLLDLSSTDISDLPDSIGHLIHLRYLSLNNTRIKCLPSSLCKLYHLQSLGLRNCYELIELPKDIRYLTNMRYLDLHLDDDPGRVVQMQSMPQGIGRLTYLRTLTRFIVSRINRRAGLSELKDMNELRGNLLISSLDSVVSVAEANDANMVSKKYLHTLELRWYADNLPLPVIKHKGVLDHLRPHSNLRNLKIAGYRDYKLSAWIGDASFFCLETIQIDSCENLDELPPLGGLPSLKKLILGNLPRLQSWRRGDEGLKLLHELVIRRCTNLQALCRNLPSLKKLEIDDCPKLTQLPCIPLLHSLKLKNSGDLLCNLSPCLPSLSSLVLSDMLNIKQIVGLRDCTKLLKLEITNCKELSFPSNYYCLPAKLSNLSIKNCPSLQALPSDLQYLQDLTNLQIQNCKALQSLPMGMKWLHSLKSIELSCCPNLSSMWTDGFPDGLQLLRIDNCDNFTECIYQAWDIIAKLRAVQINGDLIVSNEPSDLQASTSRNI